MAKTTSSIQTLYDLEKEIYKLQVKAKNIELQLDDSFDHLQDNFYKMGWNSIFRIRRRRKEREEEEAMHGTSFIQGLLSNESLQILLQQIVPFIAEKISAGLERLMQRWFKKK